MLFNVSSYVLVSVCVRAQCTQMIGEDECTPIHFYNSIFDMVGKVRVATNIVDCIFRD